jgi:hypothetical protein
VDLRLFGNDITEAGIADLVESALLPRLRTLGLGDTD